MNDVAEEYNAGNSVIDRVNDAVDVRAAEHGHLCDLLIAETTADFVAHERELVAEALTNPAFVAFLLECMVKHGCDLVGDDYDA